MKRLRTYIDSRKTGQVILRTLFLLLTLMMLSDSLQLDYVSEAEEPLTEQMEKAEEESKKEKEERTEESKDDNYLHSLPRYSHLFDVEISCLYNHIPQWQSPSIDILTSPPEQV